MNGLASDLAMSIVDSGHSYAMGLASSFLTPSSRLNEILGGLSQVCWFWVSSVLTAGCKTVRSKYCKASYVIKQA